MEDNYNSQWTGAQIDEAISDVRTKKASWDGKLDKSGGTMTGPLTLAGAPEADLGAATKKYVDDKVGDVDVSSQISTHNTDTTAHNDIRTAASNAASAAATAQSAADRAASAAASAQQTANAAQSAASSKAPATHASQHASGGSDPITPASIGAAASDHTHDEYAPAYTYGTADLTAGTSTLETGKLYFVYE